MVTPRSPVTPKATAPCCREAVRDSAARPCRSVPAAAANGASSGKLRWSWPCSLLSSPLPFASSSGWWSVKRTGSPGACKSASPLSVSGAAASRSGFLPGTATPSNWPLSWYFRFLPLRSSATRRTVAPAAESASTPSVPVRSGAANGPCKCAWTDTDFHATSGRGAIAGALALMVRARLRPVISIAPAASARNWPAASTNAVVRFRSGPEIDAPSRMAPRSGNPAAWATRPPAGSLAPACASIPAGVFFPRRA